MVKNSLLKCKTDFKWAFLTVQRLQRAILLRMQKIIW